MRARRKALIIFTVEDWRKNVLVPLLGDRFDKLLKEEWGKASCATQTIPTNASPVGYNSLKCSRLPTDATVIGGTCLLYTGDLNQIWDGRLPSGKSINSVDDICEWMEASLPRMDQIIGSVGPTESDEYFVVFEDDLFASFILRNFKGAGDKQTNEAKLIRSLQMVADKSRIAIERYLNLAKGYRTDIGVRLNSVFTSEIAEPLSRAVNELSTAINCPSLNCFPKSKVTCMYTSFWQDLLLKQGIIKTENVICSEPREHFFLPYSTSNDVFQKAMEALRRWLRRNPYGEKGGNERFGIIGYLPFMLAEDNEVKFGREYTSEQLPSLDMTLKSGLNRVFPIGRNPIVVSAVSLLYWDQQSRLILKGIFADANRYSNMRKQCSGRGTVESLMRETEKQILPKLERLAEKLEVMYNTILGGVVKCY